MQTQTNYDIWQSMQQNWSMNQRLPGLYVYQNVSNFTKYEACAYKFYKFLNNIFIFTRNQQNHFIKAKFGTLSRM